MQVLNEAFEENAKFKDMMKQMMQDSKSLMVHETREMRRKRERAEAKQALRENRQLVKD